MANNEFRGKDLNNKDGNKRLKVADVNCLQMADYN